MTPDTNPASSAVTAPGRRWVRGIVIAVATIGLLLGAGYIYLGREATLQTLLQTLLQKSAQAGKGSIAIEGVSGSLYNSLHLGHVRYASLERVITLDDVDVSWSPWQFFSQGVVINQLHVKTMVVENLHPSSEPVLLPQTLALPFQIRIADARIGQLSLRSTGTSNMIEQLHFQLVFDGNSWRLQHASAQTAAGQASIDASVTAHHPFALEGQAALTQTANPDAASKSESAHLQLQLHGNLSLLYIDAKGQAQAASGTALMTLTPFDPIPLRAIHIQGHGIDPSLFDGAWPKADLGVELNLGLDPHASAGLDPALAGTLSVRNQGRPGSLDQQRLPFLALTAKIEGTLAKTTLQALQIDMAGAGQWRGSGSMLRSAPDAAPETVTLSLHTDRFDLKALHSKMKTTRIAGDIRIKTELSTEVNTEVITELGAKPGHSQSAHIETLSATLAQDGLRLDVHATLHQALLKVQQARLQAGKASIILSGEAALNAVKSFKASASMTHFDPAAFGAFPAADVNATIDASGHLAPNWQVQTGIKVQPSRVLNQALAGQVQLTAQKRNNLVHLERLDGDLRFGPNSVQAHGSFGASADRLEWRIDAPLLSGLGPQFGGALRAAGVLAGSLALPSFHFDLDGANLLLPGQQHIKTLHALANLTGASPKAGAGLTSRIPSTASTAVLDVDMSGYSSPKLNLSNARLHASGTNTTHRLELSARSEAGADIGLDFASQIEGSWNGGTWRGTLLALQNRGRYGFTLQKPVPLRITSPANSGVTGLLHPEQITINNAVLALPDGLIELKNLEKNGAHWRSSGQVSGLPLTALTAMMNRTISSNSNSNSSASTGIDTVKGNLRLAAAWTLKVQAPAGGDPVLEGSLQVARSSGDITLGSLQLGLRQLEAEASVQNNMLHLKLALDGVRTGTVQMEASTQMQHGRIDKDSRLNLNASGNLPSLAPFAALLGQPGLEFDGALQLALKGNGSIAAPLLSGAISAEHLALNWAEQGIKLKNGQLQASLSGDQLFIERCSFDGVEGRARLDGAVRFANNDISLQLKLVLDKLLLLSRPDRTLVVSGQGKVIRDQKQFLLDGKFKAERGLIELATKDRPTLSDDVVVVGKAGVVKSAAASPSATLPLNIELEAELGDDFHLKGKGLEAQLAGNVHLHYAERSTPRLVGAIRVVSGTYDAYGQHLTIERGLVNFSGAYDNPGILIRAMRPLPDDTTASESNVQAGVEVSGTALAPVAKLVSTPAVPDSEKLAWLVLGHGTAGSASDEKGLLTTAAGALFGGASGDSLQKRLARSIGVDELGLSQAKGLESTVVTLGKRLSQRVYLNFEQGTGTASSLVKLRYKLNQRITLQFQTGANNAFDVLYTWAFD